MVMAGRMISHYRVLAELGRGGMGVIYRAEDTRLNREVALKLLSDPTLADEDTIKRFQREARAASALNHPHICTVYDVGEDQGTHFIAMELIEGQTLAEAIASRALSVEKVLRLGIQISDALDAAHKRGIVHRDLKPTNVFVTSRGDAKLLDFGLAKEFRLGSAADTISDCMTMRGQVLGTLAYMSPEQAQGKDIDARSDIFSLGAVLYEMATARRAFTGDSTAAILAEILRGQPKAAMSINPEIPEELQRIIGKAIEKERAERYQSAQEVMIDLRRLKRQMFESSGTTAKANVATASGKRQWLRATALAVTAGAALAVLWSWIGTPVPEIASTKQITFDNTSKADPLFTDGSRLFFTKEGLPVQMAIGGGAIVPIQSSLGNVRFNLNDVSPDGSELLATAVNNNDENGRGQLYALPTLGGAPRKIGSVYAQEATWSPDGTHILFADQNALNLVESDGSNPRKLWEAPDPQSMVGSARYSPDGRAIRFTTGPANGDPKIWEMDAEGKAAHPLIPNWSRASCCGRWSPDGRHYDFTAEVNGGLQVFELPPRNLLLPFNAPHPVQLTQGTIHIVAFTPSRDSMRLFVIGSLARGVMMAYDPQAKHFVPYLNGLPAEQMEVSPDGNWLAYTDGMGKLWKSRADGSEPVQLASSASSPRWSPDGKRIAFNVDFPNNSKIFVIEAEGGKAERVVPEDENAVVPSWAGDGESLAYGEYPLPGLVPKGIHTWSFKTHTGSILPESATYYWPSWSPDGKWLVAVAANPKRFMLYSPATQHWRELAEWGGSSGWWVWSHDSKAIYQLDYEPQNKRVLRIPLATGRAEVFASLEGVKLTVNAGVELSVTADNMPAIISDNSVQQIYSLDWKK